MRGGELLGREYYNKVDSVLMARPFSHSLLFPRPTSVKLDSFSSFLFPTSPPRPLENGLSFLESTFLIA